MRGRRVISLLLSLVMALSLCSGVWAENEQQGGGDPAPKKTQSDAGLAFTVSSGENETLTTKEMKFFDGMQDGYMEYKNSAEVGKAGDNKTPVIAASSVENTKGVFVAFAYDESIDDVADKSALIEIRKSRDENGNEIDNSAKVSVTYETSNDTALYVFRIGAKQDLGKGTSDWIDFALRLNDQQVYPFVINFGAKGNNQQGEGNKPQNTPLTDFKGVLAENENGKDENDNSRLTEAQKNAANDYVDKYLLNGNGYVKNSDSDTTGVPLKDGKDYSAAEVTAIKAAVVAFRNINWEQRDPLGGVQGVQIEGDWTDCFGHYLAELASRVGISLWSDDVQDGVVANVGNYTVTFYTNGDYGVF